MEFQATNPHKIVDKYCDICIFTEKETIKENKFPCSTIITIYYDHKSHFGNYYCADKDLLRKECKIIEVEHIKYIDNYELDRISNRFRTIHEPDPLFIFKKYINNKGYYINKIKHNLFGKKGELNDGYYTKKQLMRYKLYLLTVKLRRIACDGILHIKITKDNQLELKEIN